LGVVDAAFDAAESRLKRDFTAAVASAADTEVTTPMDADDLRLVSGGESLSAVGPQTRHAPILDASSFSEGTQPQAGLVESLTPLASDRASSPEMPPVPDVPLSSGQYPSPEPPPSPRTLLQPGPSPELGTSSAEKPEAQARLSLVPQPPPYRPASEGKERPSRGGGRGGRGSRAVKGASRALSFAASRAPPSLPSSSTISPSADQQSPPEPVQMPLAPQPPLARHRRQSPAQEPSLAQLRVPSGSCATPGTSQFLTPQTSSVPITQHRAPPKRSSGAPAAEFQPPPSTAEHRPSPAQHRAPPKRSSGAAAAEFQPPPSTEKHRPPPPLPADLLVELTLFADVDGLIPMRQAPSRPGSALARSGATPKLNDLPLHRPTPVAARSAAEKDRGSTAAHGSSGARVDKALKVDGDTTLGLAPVAEAPVSPQLQFAHPSGTRRQEVSQLAMIQRSAPDASPLRHEYNARTPMI